MAYGANSYTSQRGAVLLVALIMLLLVTLMAVSGFNIVKVNQQVAVNMESRSQAMVSANAAIEEAISSTLFFSSPENIFTVACGAGGNSKCYDLNGDGTDDLTVVVAPPSCVLVDPILTNELDPLDPRDVGCFVQGAEGTAATAQSAESLCAETVWNLEAVAKDDVTGASATVRQGVGVRVSTDDLATACPN